MADDSKQQRAALANVRATAIDGRLHNIYWRQDQLRQLHTALVAQEAAALEAITNDSRNTPAEARAELYLALAAVRKAYLSLNPAKELEREYRVAHGVDAGDRRDPVGIVYVEPSSQGHTLFYAVVAPLAAAIAAGNAVVVQLEKTLRSVPVLLRKILQASLDPDVYAVVSQRPDASFFAADNSVVQLLQNSDTTSSSPSQQNNILASSASALSIAVVDRTADLAAAAAALVTARFSFGGRSPYAPDLVLVNEFAKEQFLEHAVQHSIRYMAASDSNGAANGAKPKAAAANEKSVIEELKTEPGVRVVTAGSNGGILDLEKRDSAALGRKIAERCLCVHAITSLDDGIDLANKIAGSSSSSSSSSPLLATYLFSDPGSAKYLSQFIHAHASFANHFPLELLVGPAHPTTNTAHPLDPTDRFPAALFTTARPQYAKPTPLGARVGAVLQPTSGPGGVSSEQLHALRADAAAPLPANRPYKKGVGFFEQGILLGLGMAAVPLLSGISALTYYGSRQLLAYWRAA